jgi:alanine racemase
VLGWTSEIAQCRRLHAGESTGYGRRFVAVRDTWIGIVPVGYADGFRRDLSGTEVLVEGARRKVVGAISMDALAIELTDEQPRGTPVTLVGEGLPLEAHATFAATITYELACGINSTPARAHRVVIDE